MWNMDVVEDVIKSFQIQLENNYKYDILNICKAYIVDQLIKNKE